ncbi:hypothetical protein B0A48_18142 [Cryoendolithus antarcticus]|uniref:CRAL-TRIO domain-containing protein n=1 Tax=Cryoendolithus antarcticus TaxID=1507870 RepID=A0A1V8SA25_9PEZI|nr:hypothetical protein B0A48_18142 [Cryoendolithus antarcticus]
MVASKGAISSTTIISAIVISGTIAFGVQQYATPAKPQDTATEDEHAINFESAEAMAAQTLPGRPGNLTPDQEVKLKEMWSQLLEIYGVTSANTNGGSSRPSLDTPTTGTSTPTAKPKKRLGIFGSKKDKSDPSTPNGAASEGADNDKHGQNREFASAIASQSPEELHQAFWVFVKTDNPDALLLRFLRARKWDVHAAIVMLVSTGQWRTKEMHVDDDIMLRGEAWAVREAAEGITAQEKKEGEDFLAQLRMGKSFLHGIDKEGRPCCYVRCRLHRGGEQTEKSLERFTVYTIETARFLLRPPVDTATVVFDMTDFSLANMDYTPVKFMIKCFEANYPESLGSVVVYKSPWVFHSIWKIIRGWLDPVVASKVHFASNVGELETWIPKGRILKECGGDEDWSYTFPEPSVDEEKVLNDSQGKEAVLSERRRLAKEYEEETMAWISGSGAASEKRASLTKELETSYWKLDPFVRATSLYDRSRIIQPGGKLEFYPGQGSTNGVGGRDHELD